MRSDRTLKRWYRLINRKFFYNTLPNNVCVRYINEIEKEKYEDKYFAWTSNVEDMVSDGGKPGKHKYAIVISKTKNPGRTAVCASLVHEMIHVYTKMRDNHGPAFEAARQMISDRGIFRKGSVLAGLTIF